MLLSPLKISPLTHRNANGIFNLSSALHEWNYQNATDIGSTISIIDTGSVGGHTMSNPDLVSKPSLNIDGLLFDGISNVIRAAISNFRNGDSSGEFVSKIKLESGSSLFDIGSWASTSITNYINQSSLVSNTYRFVHNTTVVRSMRGSTNITSGWFTITSGCTGSAYYIIVSGNNETLTLLSGSNDGSVWLNSQTINDSIAIGGRLSSSPAYANISWKYGAYRSYISIADSISANLQIHNNL